MKINDLKTIDRYYQALVNKDPTYLGVFYVGVVTTGVFCIATCYARKPKKDNVVFYTTVKEVMTQGFRPCKRCHPTQIAHEPNENVKTAIQLIHDNPKQKINDEVLRQNNLSPSQIRRWFKQHFGMTYHAYQRLYRINQAFEEVKSGQSATNIAFDSGYESLSGFGYTYKKLIGKSPTQSAKQTIMLIHRLNTPLGAMFACASNEGICLLEFTDRKMLETELNDLQKRCQARILVGENAHIKQLQQELDEYFLGKRQIFNVKLDMVGTEFQKQVWQLLSQIPYGEVKSYLQQATSLGNPKAVRAIASANGYNKIAIIIPCHRVIGSDGSLTGYGGGLERKRWLLEHESKYKG